MEGVGFARDRRAFFFSSCLKTPPFYPFQQGSVAFVCVISLDTALVLKPETPRRPYGVLLLKSSKNAEVEQQCRLYGRIWFIAMRLSCLGVPTVIDFFKRFGDLL